MTETRDVVIIGAGTAGLSALSEVRKRTDSFLIVNEGSWGTTCARVGCMPSKALIEAADAFHAAERLEEMGSRERVRPVPDGAAVMRRVRRLRDGFVKGVLRATDGLQDRAVSGHARLLAPDLVEIDGRRVSARSVIVAAGSKPVVPRPWRDIAGVLTSDGVFEMEGLPDSMAVVGLGAVGLELAQAFSRLGVEVYGFDASGTIAGITDGDVLEAARDALDAELPLRLSTEVDLEERPDGVAVSWEGGSVVVEKALVAVGRRPSTDGLGLESLGAELDDGGLPPFDEGTLRIPGTRVFIAGDVNRRAPILHEAADDGRIAGYYAVRDEARSFCRRAAIRVVFTDPTIASVGTPDPSKAAVSGSVDFGRQSRARMAGRASGAMKLWASGDDALLGAELCAPGGEHLAHLLAWAMQTGLTVHEMLELPYYHPTFEEGLRTAVRRASRGLEDRPESELPPCRELPGEGME